MFLINIVLNFRDILSSGYIFRDRLNSIKKQRFLYLIYNTLLIQQAYIKFPIL